jgi:HAD superfamily hydrolase (TIGR01450 family)
MRPVRPYLRGSARPLTEVYDVALLDLDGVVYLGPDVIPGVPKALAAARARGTRLAFVTNNAARTPAAVADHLTELGIAAEAQEVVTSAQAAAHFLADRLPPGSRILVVGTTGLQEALRERGLEPVDDAQGAVAAVVQGYSPDMNWRLLAEGAIAINRGVPWVATNLDPTVPSPRGPLPGNGSLVAALRHATGASPVVTGKPDPTMHRESVQRSRAQRPIVVGDRLDTDIEGANAVGCASLLVLSGVTTARDLVAAPARLRPTYLARDLGGLLVPHPEPHVGADAVVCGSWRAAIERAGENAAVLLSGPERSADEAAPCDPEVQAGDLDALRALSLAAWELIPAAAARAANGGRDGEQLTDLDREELTEGRPSGPVSIEVGGVRAADDCAAAVLDRLGLA